MISNDKYEYMDITTISSLLFCSLCKKPFVDPVTTNGIDRFCRECIAQLLSTTNKHASNDDPKQSYGRTLTPITEPIVLNMLNDLLVKCTQCDKQNIKRGRLDEHKSTKCPGIIVPCTAADFNCPWAGPRAVLDDHVNSCIFEPLRPALYGMVTENRQLKEKLQEQEMKLKDLEDRIRKLEHHLGTAISLVQD